MTTDQDRRVIQRAGASRAEARFRTFREARAAARISHPSAVTVHDILEAEGRPWTVMELIDGISMRDEIQRRGGLPVPEVAKIAAHRLDALAHPHSQGVVRRDVKPADVLLIRAAEPSAPARPSPPQAAQSAQTWNNGAVRPPTETGHGSFHDAR